MNNLLKNRILEKCGDISKFSVRIHHSRSGVHRILNGSLKGGLDFWKKTKEVLNLSDSEVLEYMGMKKREESENECEEMKN